ncbi:hypothetical protein DID88_008952 [Monilinia fructigena]|uniref:Rhodopsin domain-containing protein n=1 Tax=Monilinia fructigena TaxID=38457 RepID=A0A395J6X5_9HELO|nr:hypothetical protein DID88_008952 [Monilinia fructigena]
MLGIRTYTRIYISKSFGLDDYLAVISIFPIIGFAILTMLVESPYVGWDVHAWDVKPDSLELGLKFVYTTQILFSTGITLIRVSMLWLISRLFQSGAPRLRRFTFGVLIYMIVHGSIFITTLIFQCRPVSDYWKVSLVPQNNCINQTVNLLFTSITNAMSDYLVVALPMTTVWKLQLPFKQRVSLCFLSQSASSPLPRALTWTTYPVYIWSSIEIYLALFCACVPPSVGFWKLYYPKLVGTLSRSQINASKTSRFWSSRSESNRDRTNVHELADTDDEERGIIVERGITIETVHNPKGQSMGSEGSCTAIDPSSPKPSNYSHKP